MKILPLSSFSDNYIWLLDYKGHALVIDPGQGSVVLDYLRRQRLVLDAILITHHHLDHCAGVAEIIQHFPAPVFAPQGDVFPFLFTALSGHERLDFLGNSFEVIPCPGHTKNHLSFFTTPKRNPPLLFCGDTLFSAGCGRLLGGTAAQLEASLQKIAQLPKETRVYCAHEYTLNNSAFALLVDPENLKLQEYFTKIQAQRAAGKPSLPTTLELELQINPFLRCQEIAIKQAVSAYNRQRSTEIGTFATLREWKTALA